MLRKKTRYFITIVFIFFTSSQLQAREISDEKNINFHEVMAFAGFSNAAYLPVNEIKQFSQYKNYTLTYYNNIPEIYVSYFLATNHKTKKQVISVRGTANIENAIIDIALKLVADNHLHVYVHDGFSQAATAIYREIIPHIKPGYTISTTGHSLGGAVALILAMHMSVENFKLGQVVTFGQPKVTNFTGANKFNHLNVTRVVTEKDLVPLVPPFDPVDINNLDIYWHMGKEVILLADNTYATLEGVSSMLRATSFTQTSLDENNLENHKMSFYLHMINKKLSGAILKPFEHNLNLFNLFGN